MNRRSPEVVPGSLPNVELYDGRGAASSIISTKLRAPALRSSSVERQRLLEALSPVEGRRLVLISAPAGFGKSTLASSWVSQTRQQAAWISLEESDSSPEQFVVGLVEAIRGVIPGFGERTLANIESEPADAGSCLATLISDLDRCGELAIVLDDYHLAASRPLDDLVGRLVERLPAGVAIIIATRSDPDLPLSRLRARGQLLELRVDDLRFRPDEAAAFLRETMELDLSDDEVTLVEQRTEGWAAGLQLAALALRAQSDRRAYLREYSGTSRHVFDYLIDEVISLLDRDTRELIVRISILDRFCGPLCDAIVGESNATDRIEKLDAQNLFLIPLDDSRTWYRFHHLFSDALKRELRAHHDEREISKLHERASDWLAANGLYEESLEHACRGGSRDRAITILETAGRSELARGNLGRVARWFRRVPREWLDTEPDLLFDYGIAVYAALRVDELESVIDDLERIMAASPDSQKELELRTLRWLKGTLDRSPEETMKTGLELIETVSADANRVRPIVETVLGLSALEVTGAVEAARWFEAALGSSRKCDDALLSLVATSFLGWTHYVVGDLDAAEREWDVALRLAGRMGDVRTPAASVALAGRSGVALDRNKLDDARSAAAEALEAGKKGIGSGMVHALVHLAWTELYAGHLKEARHAKRELSRLGNSAGGQRVREYLEVLILRLDLELSRRTRRGVSAARLAEMRARLTSKGIQEIVPGETRLIVPITIALIDLITGEFQSAVDVLNDTVELARRLGLERDLCEALILRASGHFGASRPGAAKRDYVEALDIAGRCRFLSLFVRHERESASLARLVDLENVATNEMIDLLTRQGREPRSSGGLTERELEVLEAIASGLTNAQAAERLFISPSTVKKHLENIYAKLGAGGRTAAIAIARDEGLL